MGIFQRLFGPSVPRERAVLERLELLEDDQARLERRFETLRGSVTGALSRLARRRREELEQLELEDPDPDPDDEDQEEDVEELLKSRSLGAARRFRKES